MTDNVIQFPGGPVALNPNRVWAALQEWTRKAPAHECHVTHSHGRWRCTLLWGQHGWERVNCSSELGLADAVANALQAAQIWRDP